MAIRVAKLQGGSDAEWNTESDEMFEKGGKVEDAPGEGTDGRIASSAREQALGEHGSGGKYVSEEAEQSGGGPVEKSYGRLTWDLCDRLRCGGCGNTAPAPVHQCRKGHVLCPVCAKFLRGCPNKDCREKIGKDLPINAALCTLAENTGATVPCRHKSCDWRVRHADLARHEKYCVFIRKGFMAPSVATGQKERESASSEESPDEILVKDLRSQLDCALCNHAAPPPIFQCRNGHVACCYCLRRLQKFDEPQCPLCSVPLNSTEGSDGVGPVVRNAHLEGLASLAGTVVPCRYDECSEEIQHNMLAEHLKKCEHQPIKCIDCTTNVDASGSSSHKQEKAYVNWNSMWEHYRRDHLPNYPPASLDSIVIRLEMIQQMMKKKVNFATWGHCLDPETGRPVRAIPGLFYDKVLDLFYFSVRIMGPIAAGEMCSVSVGPFPTDRTDSAVSQTSVQARMPPTSYRVGYFEDADLRTAAKIVRERPCLVLSGPTVRCLFESSGGKEHGGSLCFRVSLPKSMT